MVEYFLIVLGIGLLFLGKVEGIDIQEGRMDTLVCLVVLLIFSLSLLLAELINCIYRIVNYSIRRFIIFLWSKMQGKPEITIDDDR